MTNAEEQIVYRGCTPIPDLVANLAANCPVAQAQTFKASSRKASSN